MSKITNFFSNKSKPTSEDIEEREKRVEKVDKRKHSSTSSVESSSNLASPVHQVGKRPFIEDNRQMEVREVLESIDARLRTMATKSDIETLASQFHEKIEKIEGNLLEVECKVDALKTEVHYLKTDNQSLRDQMKNLQRSQNDAEQYNRRWNLRLFNVKQKTGETAEDCAVLCCQIFSDTVGVPTRRNDLEAAHRVGGRELNSQRPRVIIVRFQNRSLRDQILASRKKLKGHGIAIAEDLTAANAKLEREVYKHSATLATWTVNGKVMAKLKNGQTVNIKYGDNVAAIMDKVM